MSDDSSKSPVWQRLKPTKPWGVIASVVWPFLALYLPIFILEPFGAVFVNLPLSANNKVAVVETVLLALSLAAIWGLIWFYHKKLRDIGINRLAWKYLGYAAVAFVCYVALSIVVADIASHLTTINFDQPQNTGFSKLGGLDIALAIVPLLILTPLLEESIFRGFMFTGLRRKFDFWPTAVLVSFLFAIAHGQWNVGLDVFVMSMVSCYLVERSKSLWPSIFLHVIKNGVAFYVVYIYNGH